MPAEILFIPTRLFLRKNTIKLLSPEKEVLPQLTARELEEAGNQRYLALKAICLTDSRSSLAQNRSI